MWTMLELASVLSKPCKPQACCDVSCWLQMQHEDLSRSVGQVLEAMQRKGQQIQQLREYCDMLPT